MSPAAIVVIVVVLLLLLLAIGGAVAGRRRRAAHEAEFRARAERADLELADAFAGDKGWERAVLEDAARRVWAEQHGGEDPQELVLVAVIDLPGTDEDRATFHGRGAAGEASVTLARRGSEWYPA